MPPDSVRVTERSAYEGQRCAARHGTAVPRGQALAPETRGGRFGRMFGFLPLRDAGAEATEALFRLMEAHPAIPGADFNFGFPAGYTYLGQFIDHDITFDPTSLLGRDNDPHALVNFRTPRYDLDSLYGSGPRDQPFLYDWCCQPRGVKLLVGCNSPDPRSDADQPAAVDLPRNEQGRALLGDARNDENLIVSQLHLLFIHFHNKVVDCLSSQKDPYSDSSLLFEEARRIVRWHYQWIVVHDFLERLVGKDMAACVLQPRPGEEPVIQRRFYSWEDEPIIPVEFSAAAFRCGHSMVRDEYQPNNIDGRTFPILPANGELRHHFGGFRRLPARLEIDWDRFFEICDRAPSDAFRIDPHITKALFSLPPDGKQALPRLNLQRSRALGLPAGHDVARAMSEVPLTAEQLGLGDPLVAHCADALLRATPLWYYILCEASTLNNGKCLGPVGGRIVAEVLVGLLEGDPQSYVRQWPAWTPAEDAKVLSFDAETPGDFTMPDLVRFADPPRPNAPES